MRKGFDTPLADNILMPFAKAGQPGLEWFIVLFARCRCHGQRDTLALRLRCVVGPFYSEDKEIISGPNQWLLIKCSVRRGRIE
jgi:hypothetical protein